MIGTWERDIEAHHRKELDRSKIWTTLADIHNEIITGDIVSEKVVHGRFNLIASQSSIL